MKKPFLSLLCLTAALLIACIPLAAHAATQDEQGRFLYLDISYDTITPDGVEQILQDTFGEIQYSQYEKYLINDFGYDFAFTVNFNENLVGAGRVILVREGDTFATGDALITLFQQDVLQFIDMDAQLVERYGEPNFRYFGTYAQNYGLDNHTRFMFENGVWDAEMMEEIGTENKLLAAYSCWDNITMTLCFYWNEEKTRGCYSRLTLEFFDTLYAKESPVEIISFPPAQ